ncbi:SigE family RNA polymerase sigma factor [Nonomuraea soli]|uniref:RNA polymerase sigma-70 factor (Sigma-E family) n=1 Tax=Nonomuraea soli TaxID=1032476 RepID=A0A7W0HPM5_9ACTN|nr:SigE family RNA polymerase sigma factor [Nonomuraea soli]MBA2891024.1 RNA polymerase sigma-70 factor (sigma-E family) [Nonomuraea soli]
MPDRSIYPDFVATRSDRLLRTAFMLTQDWALAEDLLQESLAKAWFAWKRIDDPEAYVRRVLVTTHTSWWRRRWRRELPSDALPDAGSPDAAGGLDRRDALWRALGRLPARQRAVVVLRFYEDLPVAEVAEILGCQIGTVKSQSAKALAKLRVDETIVKELHP